MPTDIGLNITTSYTDTGLSQATSGVKNFSAAANSASNSTGTNFDGLFKRMERPLGRMAFAGLAEAALSSADGMKASSGAVVALERGFHTLGAALMFVNPELAFVAIAGAGLVAIFDKISQGAGLNAEEIKKNVNQLQSQKDLYAQSAELLLKNKTITEDESRVLKNAATATQEDIDKIKEHIRQKISDAQANIEQVKKLNELERANGVTAFAQDRLRIATERYNETVKAASGFLAEAEKDEKKATDAVDKHWRALAKQLETQQKALEISKQRQEFNHVDAITLKDMVDNEELAEKLSEQILNSKSQAEAKELQAHLDYVQKRIQSDQSLLNSERQTQQQIASEIQRYASFITSNIQKVNGVIQLNTEKMMGDMLKATSDSLAKQCYEWAGYWISVGNFGQAALAASEGLAIASLGSIASAALGPGTTTGGSQGPQQVTGPGGQPLTSASGGGGQGMMSIYVKVEGGIVDDNTAINIAKRISDVQNQYGAPSTVTVG